MNDIKLLKPFSFWCQKVLPLIYDESLSYYELLCKVVDYLNNVISSQNNVITAFNDLTNNFNTLNENFLTLKGFVENYFENLDVQDEINNKLDEMAEDGTLLELLASVMPFVTPQMYGAKGDGITDDTQAFQDALDSGIKGLLIPTDRGEIYKITDTLVIPSTLKSIYGTNGNRATSGLIMFDITEEVSTEEERTNKALFSVDIELLTIQNIKIISKDDTIHRYGVLIDATSTLADKDIRLFNCTVTNFYKITKFRGRGFEVVDCNITSSNYIGDFNWSDADETNVNHPASTGQRAISFRNNRLHSITNGFINIESGHAYGFTFLNNLADNGRGYIIKAQDEAWNWNISGNVFQGMTARADDIVMMYFNNGAKNMIINNNIFSFMHNYWQDSTEMTTWISGNNGLLAKSCIISNNIFEHSASYCIQLTGLSYNVAITGNVFNDIGDVATANRSAIQFRSGGDFELISIVGNSLFSTNENAEIQMMSRGSANTKLNNSKFTGNSCVYNGIGTTVSVSTNFITDEVTTP